MKPISVVIAEDDFFTREGIRTVLETEPGLTVVGVADQGEKALELVRSLSPDVLLLDLRMPPGMDGLEVIRILNAERCSTKIVALTHETRQVRMVEKLGGHGFIPKTKFQMFLPTILCVAQSGSDVFIREKETEDYHQLCARIKEAQLTEAEKQVWYLIGFSNEEIARRLGKGAGRVKNLITSLYFKLDIPKAGRVPQRIVAEQLARKFGVLEEPPTD